MATPRALRRLGPGLLCVAASAATGYNLALPGSVPAEARCEVPPPVRPLPPPATAVSVNAMRHWLEMQGADIKAIEFKASPTDEGRFGVFASAGVRKAAARSLWGKLKAVATLGRSGRNANVALASFPLSGALTAANVLGRAGPETDVLHELAELGVADERTLVILHLMVERLRGADSLLCPWLKLLPKGFGTTLYFSDSELDWLRGTTLHRATLLRRRGLQEQWRRLEPAAQQAALQAGAEARPDYNDFLWANAIFWSRAISFPCPAPGGGVEAQEGIIPGLDFANHDAASPDKWTVFGAADRPGKAAPTHVTLVCPRKAVPKPGQEIRISYGAKGNEELLFLYGFALRDNPHDVLHVPCPIPSPDDWDDKMAARLQLLGQRGLKPQLFLPAEFLAARQAEAAGGGKRRWRRWRRGSGGAGSSGSSGSGLGEDLPEGVFETLEVFTMEGRQLTSELERLASGGASAEGAAAAGRCELTAVERSGLRMAVLTTLVRLLEYKVVAQEGEEGTGPVEQDEALLAAAEKADAGGAAGAATKASTAGGIAVGGTAVLSAAERYALYYRLGQKRLTRDYLLYARGLLEKEMQQLRALMGAAES